MSARGRERTVAHGWKAVVRSGLRTGSHLTEFPEAAEHALRIRCAVNENDEVPRLRGIFGATQQRHTKAIPHYWQAWELAISINGSMKITPGAVREILAGKGLEGNFRAFQDCAKLSKYLKYRVLIFQPISCFFREFCIWRPTSAPRNASLGGVLICSAGARESALWPAFCLARTVRLRV